MSRKSKRNRVPTGGGLSAAERVARRAPGKTSSREAQKSGRPTKIPNHPLPTESRSRPARSRLKHPLPKGSEASQPQSNRDAQREQVGESAPGQHELPSSSHRYFALAAGALIVLAAALRFYHLGTQEVWLDEAFSGLLVERPAMFPLLQAESNPPLFWLLLKAFCSIFGTTPEALRALSALFSAAAVAVVTLYGARVFSRRFALGAGLFLALSPYSIYYAQEARAYSLLILLSVLILISCYDAVIHRSRSAVWVFGAAVLAAGFTHYLVALTLLPVVLWLALRWAHRPESQEKLILQRLFLAITIAVAVCAVWAVPSFLRQGTSEPHLWIADQWKHLDKLWIVPHSLLVLFLGSARGLTPLFMKQWTLLSQPSGLVFAALAAYAIALGLAWFGAGKVRVDTDSRRLGILLIVGVALPLATLFGVSFVKPLYVVARYDIVVFAYVILLAGWLAERLSRLRAPSTWLALAACAIFLSCLGYKDWLYYNASPIFQDYDAAMSADLIDEHVVQGETVVFTGMRGPSVLYYLSARGYEWDGKVCRNSVRQVTFECRILPYTDTGVPFVMGGTVTTPVTDNSAISDLESVLVRRPKPSVWLVLSRQREPINVTINRHIDVLLHRHRYADHTPGPELRRLQILRFQPLS